MAAQIFKPMFESSIKLFEFDNCRRYKLGTNQIINGDCKYNVKRERIRIDLLSRQIKFLGISKPKIDFEYKKSNGRFAKQT